MNICQRCGGQNPAYATACGNCGSPLSSVQLPQEYQPYPMQPPVSNGMKIGMGILSFLFPIVGLVLGIIYMNDPNPDKKTAGKLWLTIAACTFGLNLFCVCLYFVFFAAVASQ